MSNESFANNNAQANGNGATTTTKGKHRGPRFTWNSAYEATFFRSLCESVACGLRDGSTFKPEAWDRAIRALIENHNAYANKAHLINKTDNARKKYRLWRGLREDPEFYYNPQTRTVSASEEAWMRHLQKEPLARSLRARPFEHEEYYEILFPDVIGSGGAPKRVTKKKKQQQQDQQQQDQQQNGVESSVEPEQQQQPAAIMDLVPSQAYIDPTQTHLAAAIPQTLTSPMTAHVAQIQQHAHPANGRPALPPAPTASALTPPEDTAAATAQTTAATSAMQTRKRTQAPDNAASNQHADKRRRTGQPMQNGGFGDLTQQQQLPVATSSGANAMPTAPTLPSQANHASPSHAAPSPSSNTTTSPAITEALHLLTEAIRLVATSTHPLPPAPNSRLSRLPTLSGHPSWQERAMDIFFAEFSNEDNDLQLKIAEKVLADETKAMVFCKMPDALRRHWVKRLRELHNRST